MVLVVNGRITAVHRNPRSIVGQGIVRRLRFNHWMFVRYRVLGWWVTPNLTGFAVTLLIAFALTKVIYSLIYFVIGIVVGMVLMAQFPKVAESFSGLWDSVKTESSELLDKRKD